MSAEATGRERQYPRNLFFQAVDLQVGAEALPSPEVKVVQNKRLAAGRRIIFQLEKLISSVKAVEAFDLMGNAGLASVNVDDLALDVHKQLRNFTAEVAEAETRYREINEGESPDNPPHSPAVAGHSPQASATAGPKPGPHLVSVAVFDPASSPKAQLAAFDRAADSSRRLGGTR